MNYEIMGLNIKRQRRYHRLTQKEMAKKLECSEGYLSKVERGIEKPSMLFLEKVMHITGCDIKDLWS